ncbi:MAG TPA: hypothetical protein DG754_10335, partial [Bacteroidales bacterium]|nr:hypothetical protein [Bacteroidales bacterium]
MNHPFLKNNLSRILFMVVWIVIGAIHATTYYFIYNVPINLALIDSVVWNGLFALLSVGLWFWVKMFDIETSRPFSIFINHIGTSVFSVLGIVFLHKLIIQNSWLSTNGYNQIFEQFEPSRYIAGFFYYILIVLVFYLIIYVGNFREKVSREAELKALVKDAELNWLKLQINPHFLFNSLNSISSLTISAPEKAQDMINRLSELLRYSLKQSPNSMVSLNDEIENCKKYLEIEQVRFGSRLKYSLNFTVDVLSCMVPSMVLQPLFENAIKHSVAQTETTSVIEVGIEQTNLGISVSVSNTLPPTP